jgi:hypothetical protein
MEDPKSGFSIGDKFVYASKYGGVVFGVVETIHRVRSLEFRGVTVLRYIINNRYDSKEIHHYASVMSEEEYNKLESAFNKMCLRKH